LVLGAPCVRAQDIVIADTRVFPESMTSTRDGSLIFGSFGKGAIYRAGPGEAAARLWITTEASGMTNVLGVLADDHSHTLYACSVDANHAPPETSTRLSALRTFSLADGTPGPGYAMPGGAAAICNDIAIARDGSVFVTDMKGGRVLRLLPHAQVLEVWAEDPALLGADGIAIGADQKLYVNNVRQNTLMYIPAVAGGKAGTIVTLELSSPVESPDGFRLLGGSRFLLAEGGWRVDVVDVQGTHATISPIFRGRPGYTAVAVTRGKVWALNGKLSLRNRADITDSELGPFVAEAVDLPGP
jgi:hypothetical protein